MGCIPLLFDLKRTVDNPETSLLASDVVGLHLLLEGCRSYVQQSSCLPYTKSNNPRIAALRLAAEVEQASSGFAADLLVSVCRQAQTFQQASQVKPAGWLEWSLIGWCAA